MKERRGEVTLHEKERIKKMSNMRKLVEIYMSIMTMMMVRENARSPHT